MRDVGLQFSGSAHEARTVWTDVHKAAAAAADDAVRIVAGCRQGPSLLSITGPIGTGESLMKAPTLFTAGLLALALAGCTQETALQSGGSGMETDQMIVARNSVYPAPAPYAAPANGNDCLPWDANCNLIYNDAGGGD